MEKPHDQERVVYFVRHGQSVGNASPVFQENDTPLSEKGQRQATMIANRLQHVSFDALIASPLKRARQTAEAIGQKTNHTPEFSDLFVECIKPTDVDGKPWNDQAAFELWSQWQKSLYDPTVHAADGENYASLIKRADQAIAYLTSRAEKSLVVVTHGYFLDALVARIVLGDQLTGPVLRRFQHYALIENTGLTVIKYLDGFQEDYAWRLWTHNDHAHFAE